MNRVTSNPNSPTTTDTDVVRENVNTQYGGTHARVKSAKSIKLVNNIKPTSDNEKLMQEFLRDALPRLVQSFEIAVDKDNNFTPEEFMQQKIPQFANEFLVFVKANQSTDSPSSLMSPVTISSSQEDLIQELVAFLNKTVEKKVPKSTNTPPATIDYAALIDNVINDIKLNNAPSQRVSSQLAPQPSLSIPINTTVGVINVVAQALGQVQVGPNGVVQSPAQAQDTQLIQDLIDQMAPLLPNNGFYTKCGVSATGLIAAAVSGAVGGTQKEWYTIATPWLLVLVGFIIGICIDIYYQHTIDTKKKDQILSVRLQHLIAV